MNLKTKHNINFGTDGWRGVIADSFTFENVGIAIRGIGLYIKKNLDKDLPVFIGYDTRFFSEDFASFAANILSALDLKVIISKSFVPTPIIAFHGAKLKDGSNGTIQFTASHNPPQYCGIKYLTASGGPASVEITNEILKNIDDVYQTSNNYYNEPANKSLIRTINPKPLYFEHIQNLIDLNAIKSKNLKIVYDPMFGAGIGYLDELLKPVCNTTCIHNIRDPLFGNLMPEPRKEFLTDLIEKVKEEKANLGIATDGDADRISVVDKNGFFYSPNMIASMLLRHLVKNKKLNGAVVRTLSTTHLLDKLAELYGLEYIETKVGFKWIAEVMSKKDVLIAAEESGGLTFKNHIPDKDATLTGMYIVEMIAYEDKEISEIYKDTIKEANYNLINDRFDLHVNSIQKENLLSEIESEDFKQSLKVAIKSINKSEGIKYVFIDGSWLYTRSSGTEPMARVYFESTSRETIESMKASVKRIIDKLKTL